MPKIQLLKMKCDFCNNSEVYDLSLTDQVEAQKVIDGMKKWWAVANAAANQQDPNATKWYDSAHCISEGVKKIQEEIKRQTDLIKTLHKAEQVTNRVAKDHKFNRIADEVGAAKTEFDLAALPVVPNPIVKG